MSDKYQHSGRITFGLRQKGKTPQSKVLNSLKPEELIVALAGMRDARNEIKVGSHNNQRVILEKDETLF